MIEEENNPINKRFRGFLPVVVDVETGGFNCNKHALLEVAAVPILVKADGTLGMGKTVSCHVEPFPGSAMEEEALQFTGIDPYNPFRMAMDEKDALEHIFEPIRQLVKATKCSRAILVGHNSFFDLGFIKAASDRCKIKKNPFHQFSSFDTATLGGLAYGQTVLAKAGKAAGIKWNNNDAHSAIYDTEKTAELFCKIVNTWDSAFKPEIPES